MKIHQRKGSDPNSLEADLTDLSLVGWSEMLSQHSHDAAHYQREQTLELLGSKHYIFSK